MAKRKNFSLEQMKAAVQEKVAGAALGDVIKKYGITAPTLYRWAKAQGVALPNVTASAATRTPRRRLAVRNITARSTGGGNPGLQQELARLRTENLQLRQVVIDLEVERHPIPRQLCAGAGRALGNGITAN